MAELVGKRLGQYEILALLGRGGAGEVYRARDVGLGREVALKTLPAELAASPSRVARLDREARLLAALNHPNIATLYSLERGDPRQAEQGPFLVLELVAGEDLARRLRRGPLPLEQALGIAAQVAGALDAAHAKGIVHRDLKPANVVLGAGHTVKVLDFGVAEVLGERLRAGDRGSAPAADSATGGTVPYMSPEQLRGEEVDPRADVWAFGCLLFECLTGDPAFGRPSLAETVAAILHREPRWERLPAATPPGVRQLLERCLCKEAAARPPHLRGALMVLDDLLRARRQVVPARPSIAVLPFAGPLAEPDQRYFAEGLAEELIHELSRLPGLRVASWGSALHLGEGPRDLREVGAKLDVATVLEGSVRRADHRLRVTVRLTAVGDGSVLWSQRFDREAADVFAVQDEITAAVLAALGPTLLGTAAPRAAAPSASLEAYELYLQGRHCWHQRTPGAIRAGIERFERAARLDPTFARAYAGIADSYGLLRAYGVVPWEEGRRVAKAAADRALALDPTLAEAHLSAGMFRLHFDEELPLAEVSFRRALQLGPSSSLAQVYYGLFLAVQERSEEALTQAEIARDLDPLSPFIQALASLVLLIAGRYEAAGAAAARALDLQSDYPLALAVRGLVGCKLDQLPEAVATLERLVTVTRRAPVYLAMLGLAHGLAGRRAEAVELAAELAAREREGYVSPHCELMIAAGLGEPEGIRRALQRCHDDCTSALMIAASAGPFLRGGERRSAASGSRERPSGAAATSPPLPEMAPTHAGPQGPATGAAAASRASWRGRMVGGKYRLLEELGRGGMGVVYRAQDTFIHRQVAVKLLDVRDPAARERLRQRMHREVVIGGRLAHPGIVTLHDAGMIEDEMYLVMELIAGENLRELLLRHGALPPGQVVAIALQVLDALGYAHRQGVIHRDLKPANVLLASGGRAKIADFGIAKLRSLAAAEGEAAPALLDGLTAGTAVGTLGYMAPEQILGQEVDQRADIYALGAMLFELLSGSPFSEHVGALASSAALLGEAPPPAVPPPIGDGPLSQVVARALAVRPADRFASCEELAQALCAASPVGPGERAPAAPT